MIKVNSLFYNYKLVLPLQAMLSICEESVLKNGQPVIKAIFKINIKIKAKLLIYKSKREIIRSKTIPFL